MIVDSLIGKTFGELKVLRKDENKPRYLICRCSCNKEKSIHYYSLVSGKTKSCGHNTTNFKDLTNQQFGELIAIEYLGNSKWKCKCSCGKEHIVHRQYLLNGEIKSCGHLKQEQYECIRSSMIGRKFGHLTILRYLGDKKYECQCDCENKTIVSVFKHNLESGSTYSCGCVGNGRALDNEYMLSKITKFTTEYGKKPNVIDLEKLFAINWSQIRVYVSRYNLYKYIDNTYSSKYEMEISSILQDAIPHDRKTLNGQELDFYLPEKNLAIEFNGNYFHSDLFKDKYYHQNKTIECSKLGIRLIHIFEYEWTNPIMHDKLVNLIISELNAPQIIMGRKCNIHIINAKLARKFCNKYHLQGYINSEVNVGCYYNNELIGLMTFGKPRFNTNYQYELYRLCWKDSIRVIGGLEKLFRFFVNNYNVQSIITYCDISKFTGNSYTKLGFTTDKNSITKPNYVWVNLYTDDVKTRYQAQKHKLIEQGLGTKEQTETEIMQSLNYCKVYDSGNIKLYWIK